MLPTLAKRTHAQTHFSFFAYACFLKFKGPLLFSEGVFSSCAKRSKQSREGDALSSSFLPPTPTAPPSILIYTAVHKPLPTLPPIASMSTQALLPYQTNKS